ncbi:MAG: 16S rRNA (guanine(966)-N(2))-methyltransferase RsmD [Holosporaceae bacterium]|jgi:16S rRNA (guanine966-N2)-methyltransferase|nr:16S rRNA (guanine(966)-N(2))-methyltransferase RsmD [Holosporaceae bacterium]
MGVRIVAGKYGGIYLDVPESIRPTLSRHRESLFSMLEAMGENFFFGKIILDCFAGSGALGLEAISRGADHVYFIDNDRDSISVLKTNIQKLSEQENCITICADARQLKTFREEHSCNLVFLDPPYSRNFSLEQIINTLLQKRWISENTLLLLEQSVHDAEELDFLVEIKTKKSGSSLFTLGKIRV